MPSNLITVTAYSLPVENKERYNNVVLAECFSNCCVIGCKDKTSSRHNRHAGPPNKTKQFLSLLQLDSAPDNYEKLNICVLPRQCVYCACVCDVINGRTRWGHTGGRSHRIFDLLSAVLALIFIARMIQPFLSLVDREVEFCVLTN